MTISETGLIKESEQNFRLHTPICDLLGIDYPVLQAGMGLVAYGNLAGEVSKAGGLGVIGAALLSPEELRKEIKLVRSITDRPFGVDILFARMKSGGLTIESYSREVQGYIRVVMEERVPVIVSGLGNPSAIIEEAHNLGIKILSVVGNVKQAVRLTDAGVDAIIATGHEGGGHTGRVGTSVLVPRTVDVINVPVIAGGGLVDGRGLVAALAMGAQGVWMGTRFIATAEASVHQNYKKKIVDIDEESTVVTRCHSGKTCRLIRNNFTQEWETKQDQIKDFPLQVLEVGQPAAILGRIKGDVENGSCPAGQGSAIIHEIKNAGQIVKDIVDEACIVLDFLEKIPR